MRKTTFKILHALGGLLRWKWLMFTTGALLLSSSCSTKTDSKTSDTKVKDDTVMVTCYEPRVIEDSLMNDSAKKSTQP